MAISGDKPNIQARTYQLALRVIRVVRALGRDNASQVIAKQIARSGTSIGANVEEAQGSHSKAEFVRRMNIARSEARETLYWLRLIADSGLLSRQLLIPLIQETEEVVKILVRIVKTAREPK